MNSKKVLAGIILGSLLSVNHENPEHVEKRTYIDFLTMNRDKEYSIDASNVDPNIRGSFYRRLNDKAKVNRDSNYKNPLDSLSSNYTYDEIIEIWNDNQDLMQGYRLEIDIVDGYHIARIVHADKEDLERTLEQMDEASRNIRFEKKK